MVLKLRWLVVAVSAVCASATDSSHAAEKTVIGHQFDKCVRHSSPSLIAASPGIWSWCQLGTSITERMKKQAVSRCNASMPKSIQRDYPCTLVFDGDKIIDSRFAKAMRQYPKLRTKLTVFDAETNTTDRAEAVIHLHTTAVPRPGIPVSVYSRNVKVCDGEVIYHRDSRFSLDCLGETFEGVASNAVVKVFPEINLFVPSQITLESGRSRSYITLDFKD